MCSSSPKPPPRPAAPAAPPLEPPEEEEIGSAREDETQSFFGDDAPSYRTKSSKTTPKVGSSGKVTM